MILICFVSFRVIYLAVSLSVSIRRLFPCFAAAKPRICRPTSTRWHRPPTGVWLKRDAIKVSFSWVVLVLARRQASSMLSTISRWLQVCLFGCCSSSSSPLSATTVHCGLTSFVQLQFDVRLAHLHLAHTNLSCHFSLLFSQFSITKQLFMT